MSDLFEVGYIGLPIIFSNFLKILPYNINVFFVSYLYNDETMVAMGLGNVILSLLECFILGISSLLNKPTCNSITPHELLNRGRLGVIIVLLPSVAIALCTEPLLKLIHQSEHVSILTGHYVDRMLPAFIFASFYQCNKFWLRGQ